MEEEEQASCTKLSVDPFGFRNDDSSICMLPSSSGNFELKSLKILLHAMSIQQNKNTIKIRHDKRNLHHKSQLAFQPLTLINNKSYYSVLIRKQKTCMQPTQVKQESTSWYYRTEQNFTHSSQYKLTKESTKKSRSLAPGQTEPTLRIVTPFVLT